MGCHKMKPLVKARTQTMESGRDNRQKRNRTDQFLEKIDDRNNRPAKKQRTQAPQKVSKESMIDILVFTVKRCKKEENLFSISLQENITPNIDANGTGRNVRSIRASGGQGQRHPGHPLFGCTGKQLSVDGSIWAPKGLQEVRDTLQASQYD